MNLYFIIMGSCHGSRAKKIELLNNPKIKTLQQGKDAANEPQTIKVSIPNIRVSMLTKSKTINTDSSHPMATYVFPRTSTL
jgi:hypothetical protein